MHYNSFFLTNMAKYWIARYAKIKNNVLFVGLGKIFQIWEPKNFEKFKIVARKKAYQNRSNLKWETKQKGELS